MNRKQRCVEEGDLCGTVNGFPSERILLDTGCTQTMVHERFVCENDYTGSVVQIRCAHGDVCQYPVARVSICVAGQEFKLEAVVS